MDARNKKGKLTRETTITNCKLRDLRTFFTAYPSGKSILINGLSDVHIDFDKDGNILLSNIVDQESNKKKEVKKEEKSVTDNSEMKDLESVLFSKEYPMESVDTIQEIFNALVENKTYRKAMRKAFKLHHEVKKDKNNFVIPDLYIWSQIVFSPSQMAMNTLEADKQVVDFVARNLTTSLNQQRSQDDTEEWSMLDFMIDKGTGVLTIIMKKNKKGWKTK